MNKKDIQREIEIEKKCAVHIDSLANYCPSSSQCRNIAERAIVQMLQVIFAHARPYQLIFFSLLFLFRVYWKMYWNELLKT